MRHPKMDDAVEFTRLNRASVDFHRGLAVTPKDKKSFTAYCAKNERPENECFLICRIPDGMLIGAINLSQIIRGSFQNAYLGYYVGAEHAGCGYTTEAIRLILRFAFSELKLHRIEANIQPGNKASIRVVRKNGFIKEGFSRKYLKIDGRWRDHERWAIIFEDWSKLHR